MQSPTVTGVVRDERWTYEKDSATPRTVPVIAHRRLDGTFAPGRFGNGKRTR